MLIFFGFFLSYCAEPPAHASAHRPASRRPHGDSLHLGKKDATRVADVAHHGYSSPVHQYMNVFFATLFSVSFQCVLMHLGIVVAADVGKAGLLTREWRQYACVPHSAAPLRYPTNLHTAQCCHGKEGRVDAAKVKKEKKIASGREQERMTRLERQRETK